MLPHSLRLRCTIIIFLAYRTSACKFRPPLISQVSQRAQAMEHRLLEGSMRHQEQVPAHWQCGFVDAINDKEQSHLHLLLAQMIYAYGLDFSFVQSPYFLRFITAIRPAFHPPTAEDLSTKLLFAVHKEIAVGQKKLLSEDGVLIITKYKKLVDAIEPLAAIIQTGEGAKLFLDSYEPQEGQQHLTLENQILLDAKDKAELKYKMKIYAVVVEDQNMRDNLEQDPDLWYFVNQRALINSAGRDIENKNLTTKLELMLQDFKPSIVSEKIEELGGSPLIFTADGWRDTTKMYACYLENLKHLKKVVTLEIVALEGRTFDLFDLPFEKKLRDFNEVFYTLNNLSEKCDNPQASLAEITEGWLELEEICIRKNGLGSIDFDEILSPQLLAANFFDHRYRGHRFVPSDDSTSVKMQEMTDFLVESLDPKALSSMGSYRKKESIFRNLSQKNFPHWYTFWDLARDYHPELSNFVKNCYEYLQQRCSWTSSAGLHQQSADRLTPNRYQQYSDVHHHLRLQE